jgi:hypothetical protein
MIDVEAGRALAARAYRAGLAVTHGDGSVVPIPIGAVPVVLDDDEIARRAARSRALASAAAKTAAWRLAAGDRDALLEALGPAERRLVTATAGQTALAVARVDFLGDSALEVNATIPAMQGYSDIAAASWLAQFACDAPAAVAANGSNADALLDVLLDLHARQRGGSVQRLGLLCRRHDAQRTELDHLARRFAQRGFDVRVLHPDELSWDGEWLRHAGAPLDLLYRHLFLSRLDALPAPALEAALLSRRGTLVANRPAPHVEMKSTLAWLSRATRDETLAAAMRWSPEERDATLATVPWTRLLHEPGVAERVAASPADFVLKRSWSYGGHDVFVGRAEDVLARAQRAFPGVAAWADLVRRAAQDRRGGGFVAQQAMPRVESIQQLCTPDAVRETAVVTDYAAFASVGAHAPWGGVARAASSDIVNIVGGGAVVPVIRRSVHDRYVVPAQAGNR